MARLSHALLVSLDELVFGRCGHVDSEQEEGLRALLLAASPEDRRALRRLS